MVLPLEKVSERAMSDFVNAKKKYYLTPFMVDKIFSINPEFTWDINDFVIFYIITVRINQERTTEGSINDKGKLRILSLTPTIASSMGGRSRQLTC